MHLEPVQRGTRGVVLQKTTVDPRLEVEADRPHVSDHLLGRFLEHEGEAAFSAPAGRVHEVGSQAALAGAGGAGHEDRAAPKIASALEHRVEPGDTARDSLGRHGMTEPHRSHRQHGHPVGVDEERVLVGAVGRAAVFHDAKPPRRDLLGHPVVEQDHRVRHVFFEALSRQRALAPLAGDHGRHALVFEPAEQAAQLGPENRLVGEPREQRLNRIEHDATGADRVDGEAEPDEESLEIVLAGLLDLAALDPDVVEHDLLLLDQPRKVEAERGDVLSELVVALLEAHEHAGLVESGRAVDEEADGEEGFTAAGSAANERRPAGRQASRGDLVEAVNTGGRFG
jgi:hypothetical protein